ncbi:MAG: hypothetical protein KatS3mg108_1556 [Isosphaeraceae bacterium]|jgi:sugar phosphate isomerase/epimerase|nr:MAG: hypothetical protein KatS3mg108_1556 [Isosphaeraceae bacterium]
MFPSLYPRALGWSLPAHDQIALAAAARFSAVDLAVRDLHDQGASAPDLRRQLDSLGLRAGGFPLPVDWRSLDPNRIQDQISRLPYLAEFAQTLGLLTASTWLLPAADDHALACACAARPPMRPPNDLDPDGLLRLHLALLSPIVRILHRHGLRLALEVIGVPSFRLGRRATFIHRLDDPRLAWLVSALNHLVDAPRGHAVGLLCDTFHLYAADEPIEHALAWGPEAIAWVHVANLPPDFDGPRSAIRDDDRGLPSHHGPVPNRLVLKRLAEAGYRGPVSPEPMPGCRSLAGLPPRHQAQLLRDALQTVWPEL